MSHAWAFGLSAAIVAGAVPIVRAAARRAGIVAHPATNRWHGRTVPLLGGLALAAGCAPWLSAATASPELGALAAFAVLMFSLGLYDDLRAIGPAIKLAGQTGAAALLLLLAPPVVLVGHPATDAVLAVAWLVAITNAVNLIDNMDGLATGLAAIVCLSALVLLPGDAAGGGLDLAWASLAGAAGAFFIYNRPPASIFMGNAGSYLVGATLAGGTLLGASHAHTGAIGGAGLLLIVPLADTALVAITRWRGGRSPFRGGTDHASHRLAALGLGERSVLVVLLATAALGGLAAMGVTYFPAPGGLIAGGAYLVAVVAGTTCLARVRPVRTAPPIGATDVASRL